MTRASEQGDLIVLVADRNQAAAVTGILDRPKSLGIRAITMVIRRHPQQDPGVLRHAHDYLRPFAQKYEHALVMFDREGCGKERTDRAKLEADVESNLTRNGWADRAAAVVLDPELESWVWSDSPEVEQVLGWREPAPRLREWLAEKGLLRADEAKPARPKEAMEAALRQLDQPRSSRVYESLARRVSFGRCVDPAFGKFQETLQRWFPLS